MTDRTPKPSPAPPEFKIYYEFDRYLDAVRVWPSHWAQDQFEVIPRKEWDSALSVIERFPDIFIEGLPE